MALDELDDDAEAETARALVERKLRGESRADPQPRHGAWSAMLARKGYPAGLAFRVVREAIAERASRAAG